MPSRIMPGMGLVAGWNLGESGWGPPMTNNIMTLSVTSQLVIDDIVEELPTLPTDGMIVAMSSLASVDPGTIKVRDDGQWKTIVPKVGWQGHLASNGARVQFMGGGWVVMNTAATLPSFNASQAGYNLQVNEFGTGLDWTPVISDGSLVPSPDTADAGKVLTVDPSGTVFGWANLPIGIPTIPAESVGKALVVNPLGTGLAYTDDTVYKPVVPNYTLTDADFSGRIIIAATGNIIVPTGITRNSTLTIVRAAETEVEIVGAAGVTINVADDRRNLRARSSVIALIRTDTDQYLMFGDVA